MSKVDLMAGWAELEKALPDYKEAERYYEGKIPEIFASESIRRELERTGEAYKFNLIKIPVNARSSRCRINALKVPDNEALTDLVTEIMDANDMAVHYPDLIQKTFVYGDSYVMAWPLDDVPDLMAPADQELVVAGVEITVHDPKNCRVLYDVEHPRRKAYAILRWSVKVTTDQETWRVDLWYPDRVEQWISTTTAYDNEACWWPWDDQTDTILSSSVEASLPNEYGQIPIFHHRTALPYGIPVHKDGYGAQNALNKMLITLLTTTDSQGFPQRYGLLDKDAVLDSNTDDPQWLDDTLASGYQPGGEELRGGVGSSLRSGPGTMQTMEGMASVGQFPAADPDVFLRPAQTFMMMMAQTTNTPPHYLDLSQSSGRLSLSGELLRMAERPMIEDILWLQLLQEGPLKEQWQFILQLAGTRGAKVEVRWDPVESASGLEDWQRISAQQAAGVPVDQTLTEAGYEVEQVQTWLDADAEAATLQQRVAMLGTVASAVQSLSYGIALDVISAEDANAAVMEIVSQINQSGDGVDPA